MTNRIRHIYTFDQFSLDIEELLFLKDGEAIPLEPKEFAVLVYMVKNSGRLLTKEDLLREIWKDSFVEEQRLTQIVHAIRKKIGKEYIKTVHNEGYRFVAIVQDKSKIPDEACPWVGLRSFDEEHAQYFQCNEEEISRLIDRLERENFLAIVGASGRGKSSLVRAGIVPTLRRSTLGGHEWRIKVFNPTHSPLRQLSIALLELDESAPTEQNTLALVERLQSRPQFLIQHLTATQSGQQVGHVLLVIDQFEQIFSYQVNTQERDTFIANLLAVVSDSTRSVFMILVVRTDFLPKLEDHPELWHLVSDHQHGMRRLLREDLRLVIEKPANSVGLELEDGLVDEILDDVDEAPGKLPLLSHTIAELFKHREGVRLTLAGYRAIGKVDGAIARHADSVFASFNPVEQGIVRHILIRLTEVGFGPESDIGRSVTLEELVTETSNFEDVERIVRKLSDERLLTIGPESEALNSSNGERHIWVEISHIALIRHWPRFSGWLNEKRNALQFFHSLDTDANEWESTGKDSGLLYRGRRVENALEMRESYAEFMGDLHQRFLQASEQLAEQERQAEKRLGKRKKWIQWLTVVVLILILILIVTYWRWQDTKYQRDRANSIRWAADSISQLSFDPELSLLLAIESGRLAITKQTEVALRGALSASRVRAVYIGHQKQVISVDLSPDGKYLLTGALDGEARIWDIATEQTIKILSAHPKGVNWAAYSPNGEKIVTAGRDGTARIWDAQSGQPIMELRGDRVSVNHAIFSPDGHRVVTAGEDQTARVWNAQTGEIIYELKGHEAYLNTVAYSPDGRWIASASGDKTARVWNAQTGKQVAVLKDHQDSVLNIAFSADGKKIVTASRDRTARVWQVDTWINTLLITGHSLNVNSAQFSPDGRFILTASKDGTARVWDAQTGKEVLDILGHTSGVNTAIFSNDGRFVFTASGDHTVRKWATQVMQAQVSLYGHTGIVYSSHFSPDGKIIVTASNDRTVRLWDAQTGSQLKVLTHPDSVQCAVVSPDGKSIATAGNDGIARVWDATSGELKRELMGHEGILRSVAFSSSGMMIVTAGTDHTVRVWDIHTGQVIKKFTENNDKSEIACAVFNPDASLIATANSDNTVQIWDVANGEKKFERNLETGAITSVAFSPDGKYILASCIDQTARVLDLSDEKVTVVLRGHDKQVNYAEFSPDGTLVMTASDDRTVRLWELGTGQTLAQLTDQDAPIKMASFSPNSGLITITDGAGNVRVYICEICGATGAELLKLAERRRTRDLTLGEKERFLFLTK